ncbi:DegV family protein [Thermosipho africanus]|uniref:DegV family protein n=1 Tax=Thermosipho africanus TaxID=2421 RepID=UPI0002EFBE0E|nr:DegV family protein [Thermosipho africanus]
MEKIGIVVDSGCDVGNVDYPLKVVPLRIFVNGKEYNDGEIDEEFLFENLDGEVKTSLPNPEAIRQVMLDFINEGYKKIITFNISSNLSGTFNLFRLISQELMEKFDDVKIVNIDTLNISVGSGLIVRKCIEYIHSGSLFEDVVEKSKEDIEKSKVFYVIPTLKYLARGGRIGKVKAMWTEPKKRNEIKNTPGSDKI